MVRSRVCKRGRPPRAPGWPSAQPAGSLNPLRRRSSMARKNSPRSRGARPSDCSSGRRRRGLLISVRAIAGRAAIRDTQTAPLLSSAKSVRLHAHQGTLGNKNPLRCSGSDELLFQSGQASPGCKGLCQRRKHQRGEMIYSSTLVPVRGAYSRCLSAWEHQLVPARTAHIGVAAYSPSQ